jgi:hypothetical protein
MSNHTKMFPCYDYNVKLQKYWITPEEEIIDEPITPTLTTSSEAQLSNTIMSYRSETGQFVSNSFFFVEGIDSDKVRQRVNTALLSVDKLAALTDIKNLEYQDLVASYVFKYVIQNNSCSAALLDKCLLYLATVSEYLYKKTGGNTVAKPGSVGRRVGSSESKAHISRCSYKFCVHTYCCQYNYPDNTKNSANKRKTANQCCYSDHFVYAKLNQDVVSLRGHIQEMCENNNSDKIIIRSNQEIIKCINTIAYVTKHMYDELWNIYISCNKSDSYEKLHRNL